LFASKPTQRETELEKDIKGTELGNHDKAVKWSVRNAGIKKNGRAVKSEADSSIDYHYYKNDI
jgi:hypothetical protein